MATVFDSNAAHTKLIHINEVNVSFGEGVGANAIFIGVTMQFDRNVSPIATLNQGVMFAAQPCTGSIQVDSMLTKDSNIAQSLSSGCNPQTCTMQPSGKACGLEGKTVTASGLFFTGVTFVATAQQGYIAEQVRGVFTQLDVD